MRAVWFPPASADRLSGNPLGSHTDTTACVCREWRAQTDHSCSRAGGGGVQPASGVCTTLGVGVMPGQHVASVASVGSVAPFARNPELSDALEPSLSAFMSDVSDVLHAVLPRAVLEAQGSVYGDSAEWMREVYQYPHLRDDTRPLHSHQVVLRCPSASCDDTPAEADLRAWHAASDLHVDLWDGGGGLGCCTVHTCEERTPSTASTEEARARERHLLLHRGLVCFPCRTGGRGVHIRSMVPGWHCALLLRTAECLHGSVVLDEQDIAGFALPHLRMFRVVTYPLRRVETMLARVGDKPVLWEDVQRSSDAWVRKRTERGRSRRANVERM